MSDFEHWENRYLEDNTPWDTGHASTELIRVLDEEKITACSAIDLGCGTGTNSIYLTQRGFEVTGVDLSPTAIERAQSKQANMAIKAKFVQGDVLNLPKEVNGPFDFVFDRGCYHILRLIDVDRYLKMLDRITKPGSLGLILTGNAKEKLEKGPPVVSEEELRAELGKLFQIVRLREFRFDPIKGPDDKPLGWSCLLRRN
jgi:SAM-dependent methyltransferase